MGNENVEQFNRLIRRLKEVAAPLGLDLANAAILPNWHDPDAPALVQVMFGVQETPEDKPTGEHDKIGDDALDAQFQALISGAGLAGKSEDDLRREADQAKLNEVKADLEDWFGKDN